MVLLSFISTLLRERRESGSLFHCTGPSSYFIGAYLRSANLEGRSNMRMIENLVRQDAGPYALNTLSPMVFIFISGSLSRSVVELKEYATTQLAH